MTPGDGLCSRRCRRSTNRPYPNFGPNRLGAVLQRGWSGLRGVEPEFNMHFGYYRAGANPLRRESMDERRGASRLRLADDPKLMLLDLGCGLGATLRSIARRLPHSRLLGLTRVPWQVEHAHALNVAAACDERVRVIQGDYEDTSLPSGSVDGAYALESSCHGHGADKKCPAVERAPLVAARWTSGRCRRFSQRRPVLQRGAAAHLPQALRVLGHRGTWPASPAYGGAEEARFH